MKIRMIPIAILLLCVLIFVILHGHYNRMADVEYERFLATDPQLPIEGTFITTVDEAKSKTIVFDLTVGRPVDKTLYIKKPDGMIVKITPNDMITIKGPFFWRFFESGIRTGNGVTWFSRKFLSYQYRWISVYLDPTNPPPFTIVLIFFIGSLLLTKRFERKKVHTAISALGNVN